MAALKPSRPVQTQLSEWTGFADWAVQMQAAEGDLVTQQSLLAQIPEGFVWSADEANEDRAALIDHADLLDVEAETIGGGGNIDLSGKEDVGVAQTLVDILEAALRDGADEAVTLNTLNTTLAALSISDVAGLQAALTANTSAASTAQSTANTALSNAATAQGTANTATSNAATAQAAADAAQADADTGIANAAAAMADYDTGTSAAMLASSARQWGVTEAGESYGTHWWDDVLGAWVKVSEDIQVDQTYDPAGTGATSNVAVAEGIAARKWSRQVATFALAMSGDHTGHDVVETAYRSNLLYGGGGAYRRDGGTGTPSTEHATGFYDSTGASFTLIHDGVVTDAQMGGVPDFNTGTQTGTDNQAVFNKLIAFQAATGARIELGYGNYLYSGNLVLDHIGASIKGKGGHAFSTRLYCGALSGPALQLKQRQNSIVGVYLSATTARRDTGNPTTNVVGITDGHGILIGQDLAGNLTSRQHLDDLLIVGQPTDGLVIAAGVELPMDGQVTAQDCCRHGFMLTTGAQLSWANTTLISFTARRSGWRALECAGHALVNLSSSRNLTFTELEALGCLWKREHNLSANGVPQILSQGGGDTFHMPDIEDQQYAQTVTASGLSRKSNATPAGAIELSGSMVTIEKPYMSSLSEGILLQTATQGCEVNQPKVFAGTYGVNLPFAVKMLGGSEPGGNTVVCSSAQLQVVTPVISLGTNHKIVIDNYDYIPLNTSTVNLKVIPPRKASSVNLITSGVIDFPTSTRIAVQGRFGTGTPENVSLMKAQPDMTGVDIEIRPDTGYTINIADTGTSAAASGVFNCKFILGASTRAVTGNNRLIVRYSPSLNAYKEVYFGVSDVGSGIDQTYDPAGTASTSNVAVAEGIGGLAGRIAYQPDWTTIAGKADATADIQATYNDSVSGSKFITKGDYTLTSQIIVKPGTTVYHEEGARYMRDWTASTPGDFVQNAQFKNENAPDGSQTPAGVLPAGRDEGITIIGGVLTPVDSAAIGAGFFLLNTHGLKLSMGITRTHQAWAYAIEGTDFDIEVPGTLRNEEVWEDGLHIYGGNGYAKVHGIQSGDDTIAIGSNYNFAVDGIQVDVVAPVKSLRGHFLRLIANREGVTAAYPEGDALFQNVTVNAVKAQPGLLRNGLAKTEATWFISAVEQQATSRRFKNITLNNCWLSGIGNDEAGDPYVHTLVNDIGAYFRDVENLVINNYSFGDAGETPLIIENCSAVLNQCSTRNSADTESVIITKGSSVEMTGGSYAPGTGSGSIVVDLGSTLSVDGNTKTPSILATRAGIYAKDTSKIDILSMVPSRASGATDVAALQVESVANSVSAQIKGGNYDDVDEVIRATSSAAHRSVTVPNPVIKTKKIVSGAINATGEHVIKVQVRTGNTNDTLSTIPYGYEGQVLTLVSGQADPVTNYIWVRPNQADNGFSLVDAFSLSTLTKSLTLKRVGTRWIEQSRVDDALKSVWTSNGRRQVVTILSGSVSITKAVGSTDANVFNRTAGSNDTLTIVQSAGFVDGDLLRIYNGNPTESLTLNNTTGANTLTIGANAVLTPGQSLLCVRDGDHFARMPTLRSGATGSRPTGAPIGFLYYDTTLVTNIEWTGTIWQKPSNIGVSV